MKAFLLKVIEESNVHRFTELLGMKLKNLRSFH